MSQLQLAPYVNFQGRAREAMLFYQKILGGRLDLQAVDERGASRPAGAGDRISHARLESDGATLVGSDGHPDYPAKPGENWAIAVNGDDAKRIHGIFQALAEGGKVMMPLTRQPSGGETGWLADRFGIRWTVSVEGA